jgi:hypothetical protein
MVANQFTASPDASAAEDTAVIVKDHELMGSIHFERRPVWLQVPVGHPFIISPVLQFAVASADLTVHAEVIPFAEDQGEDELTGVENFLGAGVNDHPIGGRQGAGGLQGARTLDFHHAHPASTIGGQLGVVAQRGDVYTGLFSSFQNRRPFLHLDGFSVNCEFNHDYETPLLLFQSI